jgi:hypothetical protein
MYVLDSTATEYSHETLWKVHTNLNKLIGTQYLGMYRICSNRSRAQIEAGASIRTNTVFIIIFHADENHAWTSFQDLERPDISKYVRMYVRNLCVELHNYGQLVAKIPTLGSSKSGRLLQQCHYSMKAHLLSPCQQGFHIIT